MSLRRADHSSRGVLPTVVRRCVWSRNLKSEEAMAGVWPQLHREKKNILTAISKCYTWHPIAIAYPVLSVYQRVRPHCHQARTPWRHPYTRLISILSLSVQILPSPPSPPYNSLMFMYWLEPVGKLALFVLLKASKQGREYLFDRYSFIVSRGQGK